MAAPQVPTIVIHSRPAGGDRQQGIKKGNERDGIRLSVDFTGGVFDADRTEYRWSVTKDGGGGVSVYGADSAFDDAANAAPWFTRPDVSQDGVAFSVRVDCTFYGTGAQSAQKATSFDIEVATVDHVPDAVLPTNVHVDFLDFTGDPNPTAKERQLVRASLDHDTNTGTYDYITYHWIVEEYQGILPTDLSHLIESGRYEETCVVKMPDIDGTSSTRRLRIACTMTVFGSNGHRQDSQNRGPALDYTSASHRYHEDILVEGYSAADAPTPIRIRHLDLNLGQKPHTFSGFTSEREADTALLEYGTNHPHWLASYDNDTHLLVEVGWGDKWSYQRRVGNAWEALEPPSVKRGIPTPAPDDPLWSNGFGSDTEGKVAFYQVVFDDDDPSQISGGTYDGNLEWHWYQVPVIAGIVFDTHKHRIPETVETNRQIIKHIRTNLPNPDGSVATTRWVMRAEIVARGNDVNAEFGTESTRSVDSADGYNRSPPELTLPSVTIDAIQNGLERSTFVPQVTFGNANYNEIEYKWSILDKDREDVTARDSFEPNRTARIPTKVKRPTIISVDGETLTFYLACEVKVTGGLPTAAEGTKDQLTEKVFYVEDHQPAIAPSVEPELSFVVTANEGRPGEVWRIFSYIGRKATGLYDSISYLWHLWPSGVTQNSVNDLATTYIWPHDEGTANLTFPPNSDEENKGWVLQMDAIVQGNDGNAQKGSIARSSGQLTFSVKPPPDPVAPFLRIDAVASGHSDEIVDLSVTIFTDPDERGIFDYLEGQWELPTYTAPHNGSATPWVRADERSFKFPVRWKRPQVSATRNFNLQFRLVPHGTGNNAKNATGRSRLVNLQVEVEPRGTVPDSPLSPAAHNSLFVTDADGRATTIANVYVTDGAGTATEINDIYLTDSEGLAKRINE